MARKGIEFGTKHVGNGTKSVVYIMGWSNDFVFPDVRWLFRRMREQDWSVDVIRLPTDFSDFERDVMDPVKEIADSLDDYALAALSLGGLAGAYLQGARKRVFISPFWGFHPKWHTDVFHHVIERLGWARTPLIPIGFGHKELGEMCPSEAEDYIPKFVSLRFVREVYRAQQSIPPPEEGDVVIYCPEDQVVDIEAMKDRGIPMRQYSGGHAFFVVKDRERVFNMIAEEVNSAFLNSV